LSIVDGHDVKVLLQGQRDEAELDAVPLPGDDEPRAVGVVGVAVREARGLDGAVEALDHAAARLGWRRRTTVAHTHTHIIINGKRVAFYIAILSKALYSCITFTHSYTDGGADHAR